MHIYTPHFINNRDRRILNFYVAYTSRDEITTALESCVRDALSQDINPDTYASPVLPFLVRNFCLEQILHRGKSQQEPNFDYPRHSST
jgi:hypothetical protein